MHTNYGQTFNSQDGSHQDASGAQHSIFWLGGGLLRTGTGGNGLVFSKGKISGICGSGHPLIISLVETIISPQLVLLGVGHNGLILSSFFKIL